MTAGRSLTIFVCHASGHPTDTLPHGDGLLALEFIRRLAERGHTLHVAIDRSTIARPLPPNAVLHPLNDERGEALSPLVHMVRARALFERLRRSVRFDLIHQLNPAFTGLSLGMFGSGIPCVIGPYAGNWLEKEKMSPMGHARHAFRMAIRYAQQRHAAAILAWNQSALINVERTGAMRNSQTRKKLHIVPPGIDTEVFAPGDSPERNQAVILFLANLVRRKGIFTLLEAFEHVAAAHPTCILHIGGEGPEKQELIERAKGSRFSARIRFLGKVDRAQIPAVMRDSDVYCLPSYGEPFGMTALEAMACGKPVVATDVGGLAELVTDAGGRKARVYDPKSLASALLEVLNSRDLRRAMGEANRGTAVAGYSWPRVMDRLEEVYRVTLMGSRGYEPGQYAGSGRAAVTTGKRLQSL
jgi:L-malate glycosyltransferase